jgi:hypothetical protein
MMDFILGTKLFSLMKSRLFIHRPLKADVYKEVFFLPLALQSVYYRHVPIAKN